MNVGYPTSRNRVSMGLALLAEQMRRLRQMAADDGVSAGAEVGRLVDAEWERRTGEPTEQTEAVA